jgi:hypothetical protein
MTKSPQELAYIKGICEGMHWLWTRGYVTSSDNVIEAMREYGISVEDMKHADVDIHVLEDLKGRGATLRNE